MTPLLRKLLATHQRAERSLELETVPKLAPAPAVSSAFSIGSHIGPFELLRPLGRGGMGEVWLAKQIDGRVEREVALKLPVANEGSDVWRERFRRERDILARLVHPNIGQLYAAGVSDFDGSRGQPYLAMEYVEGVSLTDYVATRRSSIDERLKLFQQILAAVAHAHRHLVVHRDLKPANIMIDKGGRVKLLDFGIARLIDNGSEVETRDLTRLGGRMLTMRYAAPEQVGEGEISTAIDVYALGVILHEILTGLSPYRPVREGKPFTDAALLGADPSLPSSLHFNPEAILERRQSSARQLAAQIAGDLDAIILKAMRRRPPDRYASVDQFDDDIHSHLDRQPVKAREGTWRYLAGRFIARNKLPLAAAAAVVVSMALGLAMVEMERRVAIAEKARAEKHFASVRKLANSFILDLNDQIEEVPGATKVRLLLVENATRYLDQLAAESANDGELQIELANAYGRLGNILGATSGQNVGRHDDALKQYDHALALLKPNVLPPSPPSIARKETRIQVAAAREMINILNRKSYILYEKSRAAESTEANRAAYELSLLRVAAADASLDDKLMYALLHVGYTRRQAGIKRDAQMRMKGLKEAIAMVDVLRKDFPEHPGVLDTSAQLDYEMGSSLRRDPRPEAKREAAASFARALLIRQNEVAQKPDDALRSRAVVTLHNSLGFVLLDLGENENAFKHFDQVLQQMQRLVDRDPGNLQFQRDLADAEASMARADVAVKRYDDALLHVQKAYQRMQGLPAENANLLMSRVMRARLSSSEGEAHLNIAQQAAAGERKVASLGRARTAFQQSRAEYQHIEAEPQKPFSLAGELAKIEARLKEVDGEMKLLARR